VRTALDEAANVILNRPVKGAAPKSRGIHLAARVEVRKARVALARKLAVLLHNDATSFHADSTAAALTR
jgi:hypothetical protein